MRQAALEDRSLTELRAMAQAMNAPFSFADDKNKIIGLIRSHLEQKIPKPKIEKPFVPLKGSNSTRALEEDDSYLMKNNDFGEDVHEISKIQSLELKHEENYIASREKEEFWVFLEKEMEDWSSKKMKGNEEKVYKAIQILFKDSDTIEIFNKKAIYL